MSEYTKIELVVITIAIVLSALSIYAYLHFIIKYW